jgi:Protein of unknown function (DUF3168)
MSLKATLRTSASGNAGLQALLGTSPFRWYDDQLDQGTAFPAVTCLQITRPPIYNVGGNGDTGYTRMQLTIWGAGPGSENANAVVIAIKAFLGTFIAAVGFGPVGRNRVVADRDFGIPLTHPLTYQRVIDVMIFSSEAVTG